MKNIIFILLGFLLLGSLLGCEETPVFPDPGIDERRTLIDTVRRDTLDSYLIEMNVSALHGVKMLQILNGTNYEVLEDLSDKYLNQTEFKFEHAISLKEINQDTTIRLIVKIIDNDYRSFNKGVQLTVLPFSSPVIKIDGADEFLGVVNPTFAMKVMFETGLNHIVSYKIEKDGVVDGTRELIASFDVPKDTMIHQLEVKPIVTMDFEQSSDPKLYITLTDNTGTVGEKVVVVRKIEMIHPKKVHIYRIQYGRRSFLREYRYHFNENSEVVDSVNYIIRRSKLVDGYMEYYDLYNNIHLKYGENGMVSELLEARSSGDTIITYYEYFDQSTKLKSVSDNEDNVINIASWREDERFLSYYRNMSALPIENINYHAAYEGGPIMLTEWYDNSDMVDKFRAFCGDITPLVIPTYNAKLPPILPQRVSDFWAMITYYPYAFSSIRSHLEPEKIKSTIVTLTDNMGRLKKITHKDGYYTYEYNFDYSE